MTNEVVDFIKNKELNYLSNEDNVPNSSLFTSEEVTRAHQDFLKIPLLNFLLYSKMKDTEMKAAR